MVSPIALVSILLEASIGPMSNKGRITGHGNLEEASVKCRTTGNPIAASQSMVLVFTSLLFCDVVMTCLLCCVVCAQRRVDASHQATAGGRRR